jgi:hypothetical protein
MDACIHFENEHGLIKHQIIPFKASVVRVSGCRPRGPGIDSWRYQIF